jgi:hypothetical protein
MEANMKRRLEPADIGLFAVIGICAWLPVVLACSLMLSQIFGWLPY